MFIEVNIAVFGIVTDDHITDSVCGTADIDDVDEESSEAEPRGSVKQTKSALTLLWAFVEQSSYVYDKLYTALKYERMYC